MNNQGNEQFCKIISISISLLRYGITNLHVDTKKYGQSPKWSSAKRVFEKRVVKITVKTLMLIDL